MSKNRLRKQPKQNFIQRLLKPFGEISLLRNSLPTSAWGFQYSETYRLDSSRVDYTLARELYRNTRDNYKLGAAFARPVINTTAGFMGEPHFTHADPDASQALEQTFSGWSGKLLRINRNVLRDGDVFARIVRIPDKFDPKKSIFDLQLIPPEWVVPVLDPLTGQWQSLVINHLVPVMDSTGRKLYEYAITETLTSTNRTILADSRAPANVQALNGTEDNPWGFIPVVHFKNEAEEEMLFGSSDLEPLEPFLKAYHDTMLFACQGSKLFGRPKVKFNLASVSKFIEDNFTAEEIAAKTLKFADKEMFFLQKEDDCSFITADSGLAGITTLLQFLFYCIVDVSETPEFAFGTAVASSKASVSEQMVPLSRKIRRKRGLFEEPYGELSSMFLAMRTRVENKPLETYHVDIGWDELSPKNDAEVATTIKTLIEGLVTGTEAGLMSAEAAAEFLREYVPSMLQWADPDGDDDERRRVAASFTLRQRLQDGQGIQDDKDLQESKA